MKWHDFIEQEKQKPYYIKLSQFIEQEDQIKTILPPKDDRFHAFELTPFDDVKVVILGQDPYHNYNQAHGLAFSVLSNQYPPSLKNIFIELQSDCDVDYPNTGNLEKWAKQGVLLLNTCLTVELHKPLSHQKKGWETFTLEAIKTINKERKNIVFILWGSKAIKYKKYIDQQKHKIIESVHPSPLSSYRGFFGSKPFTKTNQYLIKNGFKPINWDLNK